MTELALTCNLRLKRFQLTKLSSNSGVTSSSLYYPANIYLLKVNNRNTRKRCEICSIVESEQVNVSWVVIFRALHGLQLCTFRSSPLKVFLGKGVLKICGKFTGEHPCRSVISIKLLCNFVEIKPRYGCSPVNFMPIFRAPFSKNIYGGLLLYIIQIN